jgi:cytochrome c biogenesis protein CcmG, thiol:disulfide interchange protein DsbE
LRASTIHGRVLSILLGLAALGCADGTPSSTQEREGAPAAVPPAVTPIEIVDLKGVEAALEKQKGRPFLLNFWATWCPPCVAELPELVAVAHAYRTRGVDVLSVSYDLMVPNVDRATLVEKIRKFLGDRKLDLPTLIYDASDYDAINERLGLPGPVPVTLAFDKSGRVVDREVGQATKERFEAMMDAALGR